MTDTKSAQQNNSIFKNKNTTLSTQKMGESESKIWQIDEMLQFGNLFYTYISQAHSKLWFVHKPHVITAMKVFLNWFSMHP